MTDSDEDMTRAVEATLFAAEEPLSPTEISSYVGPDVDVRAALNALEAIYRTRGINLVDRGGKWHFQTAPDMAHILRRERTLTIVAYHEPVSRAEIEAIRGVQISKGTLDVLMEAGWVRPAGRREAPGRPLTYATTTEFLGHFGLKSRKDLPSIDDLRAAGLLDPVDLAFEALEMQSDDVDGLESVDESE
jgi:segregation and condensation protein B